MTQLADYSATLVYLNLATTPRDQVASEIGPAPNNPPSPASRI